MKNTLKHFRKIKQLSQQELADDSGVSIRTIQRIENNLSKGSPYIIKALCKSLQINVDDLEISSVEPDSDETNSEHEAESPQEVSFEQNSDTRHLKLINFSSILIILFPLLNLLFPSILYWKFKKSLNSRTAALKILSFQLLWTLSTFALLIFIPAICEFFFGMQEISGHPLIFWIYALSVVLNLVFIIDTAIRLNSSRTILPFIPDIL